LLVTGIVTLSRLSLRLRFCSEREMLRAIRDDGDWVRFDMAGPGRLARPATIHSELAGVPEGLFQVYVFLS
jgi:hypothetical protein